MNKMLWNLRKEYKQDLANKFNSMDIPEICNYLAEDEDFEKLNYGRWYNEKWDVTINISPDNWSLY